MESKSSQYIRKFKTIRIFGLISSAALMTLIISTILPVYFEPDSASSATPVASETTITISSDESVNLDLVINSSTGTFATSGDSDLASFTVTTNNYTGYTLSISGRSSNDEENKVLVNSNTSSTLSSISSAVDSSTFANSSDLDRYNNKWGFVASKYNSTTSSYDALLDGNYQPAPTKSGTVLNKTTCANNTTSCPNSYDTYAIGLGARVDYTMPSGVYSNTYTLTAVGNPVAYAINYTDDSGDTSVANLPNEQVSDGSEGLVTSVVLAPDSTPTRTGYLFKSWCEGSVNTAGTLPAATTCTGTEYSAGDTIYLDQTTGNEITLYAVWTISIQSFTADMCSTLASSSNYQTFDLRDNKYYNVRYINGNCWMTSNLRFTGTPTDVAGKMTLSNSTSNVSASYTDDNPLVVSYGDLTTGSGYSEPRIHTGFNAYTDGETTWYNYAAASAGSITGDSNTTEASYSVCPAGWKLPSKTESDSIVSYSDVFNPGIGGFYTSGGAISYANVISRFTSSTPAAAQTRYGLYYTYSATAPSFEVRNYSARFDGIYVRCIKIEKISDVVSMQQLGSLTGATKTAVIDSMTTNTAYTLPDIRDNKSYQIKKLATGDVWMTQNLTFAGTLIDPLGTNINTTKSITWKSLASDTVCKTASNTVSNTTNWCRQSGTNTAWYNYAAASAGTITGVNNTNEQVYDICPAGWKLPSAYDNSGLADKQKVFNAIYGGYYDNGAASNGSPHFNNYVGYWWASENMGTTGLYRYALEYGDTDTSGLASTSLRYKFVSRFLGFYVRCVVK